MRENESEGAESGGGGLRIEGVQANKFKWCE